MNAAATATASLSVVLALTCWLRLRTRMELVARACHELRTPLCAARLAVDSAARQHGQGAVEAIDFELARAGVVLADLTAARTGQTRPGHFALVDVGELLRDAQATWSAVAWPLEAEVHVEPGPAGLALRGDRLRLLQAVGNLVGNALEHGRGDVVLRARATPDSVRLEIDDAGSGLTASIHDLMRRPRGGRGSRGRGLAITAEIASRHGGRLTAAPAATGARMVLELPAVRRGTGDVALLSR